MLFTKMFYLCRLAAGCRGVRRRSRRCSRCFPSRSGRGKEQEGVGGRGGGGCHGFNLDCHDFRLEFPRTVVIQNSLEYSYD